MSVKRQIASISLDLDDEWTYLKTHGDPSWEAYPSYLQYAIPRILDFLDEFETTITFFLVAQDAEFSHNHDVLKEIAHRGHEIASHTYHHDPWLQTYTEAEVDHELEIAEEAIERVTGVLPMGFRGPGFSFSPTVLAALAKRGYQYDASTFPNILNPLARLYFLSTSSLTPEERERRKGLFGRWTDGFRPNRPFEWVYDGSRMLEIPVTTMPIFKVPIHASYVLYLGTRSPKLGLTYFRIALALCRMTGTQPSILLHPLDFVGEDDTDSLSFFPAMRMGSQKKLSIMAEVFGTLKRHHDLVTMADHATHLRSQSRLASRRIRM